MSQDVLKISEFNKYVKDVLNAGFPQEVWICGELQQYNRNKTKRHIFFELVEKDAESKDVKARIGLVIFAGRNSHIQGVLKKSENAFELKDDIEVKFKCKVDFYVPHGALRLVVEDIDPTYTLGKLAQEKQKLIAELKKAGTLDKNKQLELTAVPLNLGLVTSFDSAAYNDFISEMTKSGFGFKIFIENALVQGKNAEADVCRALNKLKKVKDLDAVVITRGGGSIAELSCFDSKLIAEAIAEYPIPVLTGIGHEIDLSVTDLAAHTFAKTPTAVAQLICNRIQWYIERADELIDEVISLAQTKISDEKLKLRDSAMALQANTIQYLKGHGENLVRYLEILRQKPVGIVKDSAKSLSACKELLGKTLNQRMSSEKLKLKNYEKIVNIVHPKNTLKRGFSLTRTKDGKIVKSVKDVNTFDEVTTEVGDGCVRSTVN